jgi:hypothetical protein
MLGDERTSRRRARFRPLPGTTSICGLARGACGKARVDAYQ